jgi:DNA phosphorothioation-associated DGQHR protein 1
MQINFPYRVPALRVEQPLGDYYVTVLPAQLLLDVAYSDILSATSTGTGDGYKLDGTQRLPQPKRLQPIAEYINRIDSAFPNSIILAANFRREDGLIEDEDLPEDDAVEVKVSHPRWTVEKNADGSGYMLTIPTKDKLAAIIDGQHRIFAFASADQQRLEMDMICSVFLDLPKPFQAQLFATINSTQKPVDKSLTYELFGYNIEDESENYWSPDKLAVYLTRKLGTEEGSPFKGRIKVAPKRDAVLENLGLDKKWRISTAVVVEGIMRLITTNPKKDSTELLDVKRRTRSELRLYRKDKSPLRECYLDTEDAVIYQITLNFLKACDEVFWKNASSDSFITKTVGVQALFDVLRSKAHEIYVGRKIGVAFFIELLSPARDIDFSSDRFKNASGSGRTLIRRAILEALE